MIEKRAIISADEWLEWRRRDVTASDVAAVFGLHPYKTPLELWAEKSGLLPPKETTGVMRRGLILEPAVAAAVAIERPDWKLSKCLHYFSDTDCRVGSTPDYWIDGDPRGRGVLQCKTASPQVFETQFENDRPPFWITLQTATDAMVPDVAFGVVGVLLIDSWSEPLLKIYDVPRNAEAEARVRAGVLEFWNKVESGEQPAVDYDRDSALLSAMYPEETPGSSVDLAGDNELPEILDERRLCLATRKQVQDRLDAIDARVKEKLGEAEHGYLDGWRITWRNEPRDGHYVKASNPRVLRITKAKESK